MIAYSSSPSPEIDSSDPARSGRCAEGFLESATSRSAQAKPAAATGTLIRKIEPHQKYCRSRPPMIEPSAIPAPLVAAHRPMADAGARLILVARSAAGSVRGWPVPAAAGRDLRHRQLRRRTLPARHGQGRRSRLSRPGPRHRPELLVPPVVPIRQPLGLPARAGRQHHQRTDPGGGAAGPAMSPALSARGCGAALLQRAFRGAGRRRHGRQPGRHQAAHRTRGGCPADDPEPGIRRSHRMTDHPGLS